MLTTPARALSQTLVCLALLALFCFFVQSPLLADGATTIYGEGGTSANLYWATMIQQYPYYRDSVNINWLGKAVLAAMADYSAGLADFLMVDSRLTDPMVQQGYMGLPLMGSALIMVYNLPSLGSHQLVLDGETLALIWCGNVSNWNDSRIQALNQGANLPNATINLTWYPGETPGTVALLKEALGNFSSVFKQELAAANNLLENIPAMKSNNWTTNNPYRLTYVQQNVYSMTYYWLEDVLPLNMKYAAMQNRYGNVVQPSSLTVQSAMNDFATQVEAGNLATPLYNGPGEDSWPIPFITFVALFQNTTRSDCSPIRALTNFIAWTQLNDQVIAKISALGYMPLAFDYRSKLISLLGTIRCNGELALPTAYLLGTGPYNGVFTLWSDDYSNNLNTYIKVYSQSSDPGFTNIDLGAVEFTVNLEAPSAADLQRSPDVISLPITATAIVPGYYLPTLFGNVTLSFDLDLIAKIYLNQITVWNDGQIAALNPNVTLPNISIIVTADSASSANTVWIQALRAAVPQFAQNVAADAEVTDLPVFVSAPSRTKVSSNIILGNNMKTAGSFGMSELPDILSVRGLSAGSIVKDYTTSSSSYDKRQVSGVVSPTTPSVLAALNSVSPDSVDTSIVLAESADSWPIVVVHRIYVRSTSMTDCLKAGGLADWIYWTQTASTALASAESAHSVVPSQATSGSTKLANFLAQLECEGVHVSSVYGCINNGTFCSNHGTCQQSTGVCACQSGWEGEFCQNAVTASDSSLGTILGAVLGTTLPVGFLLLLLLFIVLLVVALTRRRNDRSEWELDMSELEMGEQLGAGGYGVVYKAKWRGTEVAVKTMVSNDVTKDMERAFREEVTIMTTLRHPNVVLFMAASTKAPNLCIVMEYMALGSLFDLLRNELIPELPFILKAKMAYQTAKGMHFLHSSGVVHRDLKSMNLLLDNKWNVKVSDFGLTKFRASLEGDADLQIASVHWAAPEILAEAPGVDYILTDVYSFGIILWELLTREFPYYGLSPASIAVAVLRDDMRPEVSDEALAQAPPEYTELMKNCWHRDPIIRPTFLEVMTRLSSLTGETATGGTTTNTTSKSSSSSGLPHTGASWTLPDNSQSSGSSSSRRSVDAALGGATGTVHAPTSGTVILVFTDITRSASLWEFNSKAMMQAMLLHNDTLRGLLHKHRGYEVKDHKDKDNNHNDKGNGNVNVGGGGSDGSLCIAFHTADDAVEWCMAVQSALLRVEWPSELLDHPGAAEEWGDTDDRAIFKGLRVRMGINAGQPRVIKDALTRRVTYQGSVVNLAAQVTTMAHGGQILLTKSVYELLKNSDLAEEKNRLTRLGMIDTPGAPEGVYIYELKARGLEARFYGGVIAAKADSDMTSNTNNSDLGSDNGGGEMLTMVGEGFDHKEDHFLGSANMCRWVINYDDIHMGKQVGMGSYGVVFRGKWKGVDVAVKKFINQRFEERRLLEFRSEMAALSELHHPNIVLFIGACVKRPNMCILTEFMPQGSLADLLGRNTVKIEWTRKLKMLRSAAVGVNYLHSLDPCIIHRDLKPSNLLVDDSWGVKVADFGLARIKEDNMTMTRCGTPCWTAPEVIQGKKYDERADVYSFGIIMWQVITRKQPYAGRNFMGVSLDVLEGKRPQIPPDCPDAVRKVIKKCWHASPDKRPSMEKLVAFFDGMIGDNFADKELA